MEISARAIFAAFAGIMLRALAIYLASRPDRQEMRDPSGGGLFSEYTGAHRTSRGCSWLGVLRSLFATDRLIIKRCGGSSQASCGTNELNFVDNGREIRIGVRLRQRT